jgi:hypothetical protein
MAAALLLGLCVASGGFIFGVIAFGLLIYTGTNLLLRLIFNPYILLIAGVLFVITKCGN